MPRVKPTLKPLSDLEPEDYADCFALLADRIHQETRAGKPFILCRFRDARRSVGVTVWSDSPFFDDCTQHWQVGKCYKLRGRFLKHERYGEQIELEQIRAATEADRRDGFDPATLVEKSGYDPEETFAALRGLAAAAIGDEPLRRLVLLLLDRHGANLRWLPGSLKHYYPFAGGWLEHTLSVAHKCLVLADLFHAQYPELRPPLNRDLVVAGAILHDIGRAAEVADPLTWQPSVPGKLFGHVQLGRDLVREAARDVPELNSELLQLLEHLVLTHLSLPEWGSPRLPCVPECLILHHVDDLDAKLEMYVRCLTRDTAPGPFTDRDPVLNKSLLKQREV